MARKRHNRAAWKDNAESMIVRKMRNNVVKKYPKDFNNSFISQVYTETTDESVKSMRKDVTENANQELLDFDYPEEPESSEVVEVDQETGEVIRDMPDAEPSVTDAEVDDYFNNAPDETQQAPLF